ncbi:hypothetical protein KFE25_013054 [Diacronema lutheri]|uniref:DUF218 domain-containing protein n=1 Tax=Diacronema lutheri TaxID=2081491 RepID=A0A7R9YNC1_DIALT|nr:hypothetical protein KFE25_013054 [Diacronema lutheri]|mmetsp:Transcript_6354/g.19958  ORF Transcript_6354/g.19958 Transcript_6354/m.19958 type:complete len:311 (+) Transcript_6354:39-971(+)
MRASWEGAAAHGGRGGKARTCRTQLVVGGVVFFLLQYRELLLGRVPALARRPFSRDALPAGDNPWGELDHLIVVCGHAVLTTHAALTPESVLRDDAWALEPYQRGSGQVRAFVQHIAKGVELAARDARALLLFSGGMTRHGAGPRSEAKSYWEVADALGWSGHAAVRERALLEEHAHDSFENVLFSLCRFRQLTGAYPRQLTVVSFGFKRRRFAQMHRAALRWPERRFAFVGIDPAEGVSQAVRDGEHLNSAALFAHDPYGCVDARLTAKRLARNPFHDMAGYPKHCPELQELFAYCSDAIYAGELPWAE